MSVNRHSIIAACGLGAKSSRKRRRSNPNGYHQDHPSSDRFPAANATLSFESPPVGRSRRNPRARRQIRRCRIRPLRRSREAHNRRTGRPHSVRARSVSRRLRRPSSLGGNCSHVATSSQPCFGLVRYRGHPGLFWNEDSSLRSPRESSEFVAFYQQRGCFPAAVTSSHAQDALLSPWLKGRRSFQATEDCEPNSLGRLVDKTRFSQKSHHSSSAPFSSGNPDAGSGLSQPANSSSSLRRRSRSDSKGSLSFCRCSSRTS